MKTKGNWVIKTSTGLYWCGNNLFDEQIRKAQIYFWKESAEGQAAYIFKKNKISEDITWEVVAVVGPQELKDTEAEWIKKLCLDEDEYDFICSNCGASALNDYNSIPTDSKFCPNCGRRMINSRMED